MATQHRSVWEIRFHAMGEYLKTEKQMIERKLVKIVLDHDNYDLDDDVEVDKLKSKLMQIEKFQDRFKTFETRSANRVFLLRDH